LLITNKQFSRHFRPDALPSTTSHNASPLRPLHPVASDSLDSEHTDSSTQSPSGLNGLASIVDLLDGLERDLILDFEALQDPTE
jgi:hypothetical protein